MHKLLNITPAEKAEAITPSDSTSFTPYYRGLYVGGAGNVAVLPVGQTATVVFQGIPAGTILPIIVSKVLSTGTTATRIVGLR